MSEHVKARRGDLAVLVTESRTFHVDGPAQTSTRVELALITSVTRDGIVKAVRYPWQEPDEVPVPVARMQPHITYVMPAAGLDVPAVLDAARAQRWAHRPDAPKHSFDTLDEVRTLMRAHRHGSE